ncbi:MAG TPA: ATP synthase F1 subunit epsilon [Bacteroidales bacterium]|nr:ATP synthase F1 subunit epsilon [Bacteroidales bacterium]
MKLEILTPEKSLFKGMVRSVTVPGKKGAFMVLNNHAPIISTLSRGTILITTQDFVEEEISILGGVVEVKHNTIIVLVDLK